MTQRITTIEANLLRMRPGVLAHGVNMQGKFGKGLALEIRRRMPAVYEDYMKAYTAGQLTLGHVVFTQLPNDVHVASIVTQQYYGKDPKTRFMLPSALCTGLSRTITYGRRRNLHVYMPQIGAGLGHVPWEETEQHLIETIGENLKYVTVCVLPPAGI